MYKDAEEWAAVLRQRQVDLKVSAESTEDYFDGGQWLISHVDTTQGLEAYSCRLCGSLVREELRETHAKYHKKFNQELAAVKKLAEVEEWAENQYKYWQEASDNAFSDRESQYGCWGRASAMEDLLEKLK